MRQAFNQALEGPPQKLGLRNASEISLGGGGKKGVKKGYLKSSYDKLKKYQHNVKFRIIFKTYRIDTEEGRRQYLLENEHSYTSPS
jgi:hypothetical protein